MHNIHFFTQCCLLVVWSKLKLKRHRLLLLMNFPCIHAQIFTNGRYKSAEHRAVVDTKKERLSIAAFHSPSVHAVIGPLMEMVAHEDEAVYKSIGHDEFMKLFFSSKLEGKSFLDRMKKL